MKGDLILGKTIEEKMGNVEVVLRRVLRKAHIDHHLVAVSHTFVEGYIDGGDGRNFIGIDCKTVNVRLHVEEIQVEDKKKGTTLYVELDNGTVVQQASFPLKIGRALLPLSIEMLAGSRLRISTAEPAKVWYAIVLEPKITQSQIVTVEDEPNERIQLSLE